MQKTRLLIFGILIAGFAGGFVACRKQDSAATLRTATVKRGNIEATISATGTVEPEELVDVGAQVAGIISSFGKDKNGKPIDYGSVVEEGTVLARIDDSLYTADVETGRAMVQKSQADQASAAANVIQAQAKLDQAQRDWDRAQKLGPSEALSPSAYDQYKANFETAKAGLTVAQASIEQARAGAAQAQAQLDRALRNLSYCTIKSPVKGVIIDRRVNTGQTVVSSLSAPSLFLIAKDLTRIQVWVSVNEADVGNIHPGMPVTFTVDAFPGQTFRGQVGKVRLNATMTQNVVNYTVEVTTENPDGKLLPYLTANARFVTGSAEDVLLVPTAALRWQPASSGSGEGKRGGQRGMAGEGGPPAAGAPGGDRPRQHDGKNMGTVYVMENNVPKPVKVEVGLTDGAQTQVASPDLAEGATLVVGEAMPQGGGAGASSGASPFTPQIGRPRNNAAPASGR